ncbi:hypothetical protein TNCT_392111 [Trichonephila clavata]|uniref:Uncharacterized protein n=1 Tax=Trichonephila clavata TaxID=2740835 RepID=A0A8X6G156_TRICU|nr:hypothetical protein TNCT_392111 [Trichonephila clavata]
MQSYTSNPPIAIEIKKQAIGTFVKIKASHREQLMNECKPSTKKTQMPPLDACEKLLQDTDENKPMNSRKVVVKPLEYIEIKYQLLLII